MSKRNSKYIWFLALGIAIIVIAAAVIFLLPQEKKLLKQTTPNLDVTYTGPQLGGDFTLLDSDNKIFDSKSKRGKFMLVYFGFTFCPDICPASLNSMVEASNILKNYNKDIQFIFITVDPKRDTSAQLKNYFAPFNGLIIPLTGTESQVKQTADMFKVYYALAQDSNAKTDYYLVNHSSFFYLIDRSGNFLKIYPSGVSGVDMGYDLLKIIKKNS